MEQLVSSKR